MYASVDTIDVVLHNRSKSAWVVLLPVIELVEFIDEGFCFRVYVAVPNYTFGKREVKFLVS